MKKKFLLLSSIFFLMMGSSVIAAEPLYTQLKSCIDQEVGHRTRPSVKTVSIEEKIELNDNQYYYAIAEHEQYPWGFYIELAGDQCKLLGSEFVQPIATMDLLPEDIAYAWIRYRFEKHIEKEGFEAVKPQYQKYQSNLSKREIQVAREMGLL